MYVWDLRGLAKRIRRGNLSPTQLAPYYLFTPLLGIANSLFFCFFLLSHQVFEFAFRNWLPTDHPSTAYYNHWCLIATSFTVIAWMLGIYICYRTNKRGDNKDFIQRVVCLRFPINLQILVYNLAIISIVAAIMYLALQERITILQESIWPTVAPLPTDQVATGFFGEWHRTALAFVKLPLAPLKIKLLFHDIRAMIMLSYPALSLLPLIFLIVQAALTNRMLKKINHSKSTPPDFL